MCGWIILTFPCGAGSAASPINLQNATPSAAPVNHKFIKINPCAKWHFLKYSYASKRQHTEENLIWDPEWPDMIGYCSDSANGKIVHDEAEDAVQDQRTCPLCWPAFLSPYYPVDKWCTPIAKYKKDTFVRLADSKEAYEELVACYRADPLLPDPGPKPTVTMHATPREAMKRRTEREEELRKNGSRTKRSSNGKTVGTQDNGESQSAVPQLVSVSKGKIAGKPKDAGKTLWIQEHVDVGHFASMCAVMKSKDDVEDLKDEVVEDGRVKENRVNESKCAKRPIPEHDNNLVPHEATKCAPEQQSKPSIDPVCERLGNQSKSDPSLKALLMVVAAGIADEDQVAAFEKLSGEISRIIQQATASESASEEPAPRLKIEHP